MKKLKIALVAFVLFLLAFSIFIFIARDNFYSTGISQRERMLMYLKVKTNNILRSFEPICSDSSCPRSKQEVLDFYENVYKEKYSNFKEFLVDKNFTSQYFEEFDVFFFKEKDLNKHLNVSDYKEGDLILFIKEDRSDDEVYMMYKAFRVFEKKLIFYSFEHGAFIDPETNERVK